MNKKKLIQVSVAATIAAVLLIPGNIFVRGQILPDTTPPSVTITHPATGANLNKSNVNVTGTATDDVGVASVEIFLDNMSKGKALVTPANGTSISWSMTLTLLAQGMHNVTATAKDIAGNARSASVDFIVDTTPPSILAPLPITVQTSTAGGALSSDPSIKAFLAGALTLDAIDPHPTVTNNAPMLFPLGKTTVTFTATDAAGNSASDSSTVTVVDTIPPSITITQPTNGSKFNTTSIIVKGTVSDTTLTSVEILVDNVSQGSAALANTTWTKTLTLVEGSHIITAKAKDNANNTSSASISVIIDTTAPTVSITSPPNNATLHTSNISITGTAADANGVMSVHVSVDNGAFTLASGTTSWSFSTTLPNGTHTITAKATDMVGNTSKVNVTIKISTLTAAIVLSPTIGGTGTVVTVSGSNFSPNATITIKFDNIAMTTSPGTVTTSTSGTFSATITIPSTATAGNHIISATDGTRTDSETFTVLVNTITIASPANGAKINSTNVMITGTVNNPSNVQSVKVSIDGGMQLAASLNTTSGIWKLGPVTLAQGNHTAKATVTNLANDIAMATVSFIIDTTPPSISIVSPANNATLTTTNVQINGTASDANGISSVAVSVDNGSASATGFDANTGKWTIQTTLTNGMHTIKATATDMAGNKASTSITVKVITGTVDTIAPSIQITSINAIPLNGTNANKFNVTISGTASDNVGLASVQVKIDNGIFANAIGTTSWSFNTIFDIGNHTVTAKATDQAGNMNTATRSFTLQSALGNQPPAPQTQNTFSCNGQEFKGKLELNNAKATFIDCKIKGSVRIKDSAVLFQDSEVKGNVKVQDSSLTFDSNELKGNLHMAGGSLVLKNNEIRGNVHLCNTKLTQIDNNKIKGNIKQTCENEEDEDEDEAEDEHEDEHEDHGSNSGHNDSGSGSSHEKGKDGSDSDSAKHNDNDHGKSGKGNGGSKHDKDHDKEDKKSGKGHSKEKEKDKGDGDEDDD